jgi:hypothetical protein
MASRKGPVIKQVRFTRPAEKDRADLPPANLASFKELLLEMKTGQYSTGRDLKQRQGVPEKTGRCHVAADRAVPAGTAGTGGAVTGAG